MWKRIRKSTIRGISLKNDSLQTLDDSEMEKGLSSPKFCALAPINRKKTTIKKLDPNLDIP